MKLFLPFPRYFFPPNDKSKTNCRTDWIASLERNHVAHSGQDRGQIAPEGHDRGQLRGHLVGPGPRGDLAVRGQVLRYDLLVVKLDQEVGGHEPTLEEVIGHEAVDHADGLANDAGGTRDPDRQVGVGCG